MLLEPVMKYRCPKMLLERILSNIIPKRFCKSYQCKTTDTYLYRSRVPLMKELLTYKYGWATSGESMLDGSLRILDELMPSGVKIFSCSICSQVLPTIFSATWAASMYMRLLYRNPSRKGIAAGKNCSRLYKKIIIYG